MTKISPPLKWHGGKHDLARWVVSLMPLRCQNPGKPDSNDLGWLHYVEPYFGGGAVLLENDPKGISEVVNDKCGNLTNFWRCLQQEAFEDFLKAVAVTPFSEPAWKYARCMPQCPADLADYSKVGCVNCAVRFFVTCRQSLAGRMKGFTGITKTRVRRGMNNEVSAWLSCIDGLSAVHERLKRVLIIGPSDALEVIRKHDGPRTLFYLDPPYLPETRATIGEYEHEMNRADHQILLQSLSLVKGRFLLSGYRSAIYDEYAFTYGWTRHEKKINNHAAGGKTKRIMTECVWCNY